MSTFRQLVDRTLQSLQGDALDQTEQTHLTAAITDADLELTVDDPSQVSAGLAEIGDELVWVKSVNRQTSVVTLSPYGRGYRSTTAAGYDEGTAILNNPRYSRARVKEALNTAIESVYPDLFVVKNTNISYVAARLTYELPADCEQIHSLSWESIGPSRMWIPINQYRFDPRADTTDFPNGKSVDVYESIIPGRDVRVTYLTSPSLLEEDADDFVTTTGLSVTAEEAIVYGACHRLVGFMEPARLQTSSVESSARSQLVQPGASVNAAKFFYGLYLESVNTERERLLRLHPGTVHRTRRLV